MKLEVNTKYNITYPLENYKYYNANSGPRKRLTTLLLGICKGYCMYCGKKVTVESDEHFQIEHAVDKDGNMHQEVDKTGALVHCKYNLAISCPECNQVCKKVVDKINLLEYDPIEKCPKICEGICEKYGKIRKEYIKKNAIILQPVGIDSIGECAITYNLLKHIYEPAEDITDEESIFLIQNHIDRFKLNGERFSPAVIELCVKIDGTVGGGVKDIKNLFLLLDTEQPENIIGIDFIEYLKDNFGNSSCDEIDKFCKMLVILDSVYSV